MLAQSTYFEVIHPQLRGAFSWVATLTNQPTNLDEQFEVVTGFLDYSVLPCFTLLMTVILFLRLLSKIYKPVLSYRECRQLL